MSVYNTSWKLVVKFSLFLGSLTKLNSFLKVRVLNLLPWSFLRVIVLHLWQCLRCFQVNYSIFFVENRMRHWNVMGLFSLFHFRCDFFFCVKKIFISNSKFKQECLGNNQKNSNKMQDDSNFAGSNGRSGGKLFSPSSYSFISLRNNTPMKGA